jgi:tRNA 5-methylaminomethyl-2-thiouridine biosynthesis bifunctional protein
MSSLISQKIRFIDGVPYSDSYQDVYYSRQNGLEESRYVFLKANDLPDRWRNCQTFTIAETGFGSGLNFLAIWDLWKKGKDRPGILHYISIEKHPLGKHDLATCHREFPELARYSRELIKHYPMPNKGFHRIWLDRHRICLTLCFDDVVAALEQLYARINCWFLDGFAPPKNPEMWSKEVFRQIARLSGSHTTLSTFTAASAVRSRLSYAGFSVRKISGFGKKREMIVAGFEREAPYREPEPWFKAPIVANHSRDAVVVGSGIAGAQAAWHLAQRGWQVRVLERHSSVGMEASGNPMAVISPKVTAGSSIEESFSVQCFQYLYDLLNQLELNQNAWSPCGVLQLACSPTKIEQWQRIAKRQFDPSLLQCLSAKEASNIAGVCLNHAAIFYPLGGWLNPRRLIDTLLQHPRITVSSYVNAVHFSRKHTGWHICDQHNTCIANAHVLIIASGRHLTFNQTASIPNTPVLGQSTYAQATNTSRQLKTVLQHDGYITPAHDEYHLLGATFDRNINQPDYYPESDLHNLFKQKEHIPEFSETLGKTSSAHAAVRITSANRMPIVGAIADEKNLRSNYRPMLRRHYAKQLTAENYYPGLYIAAAYGSRGMTNAALGGELLASIICNEPLPIQSKIYHCVHPARHIVRDLKRHPRG